MAEPAFSEVFASMKDLEFHARARDIEKAIWTGHEDEGPTLDPLRVLLEDDEAPTLWEYEGSRLETFMIPGHLHDAQRTALERDSRHKWLFWANQSGKTSVGAIECALLALGRHPNQTAEPPLTIFASSLTWELWETIQLPELLTWIPDSRIIDAPPPGRQSTKRVILIRADNGRVSRIVGKSADQGRERYQGRRIHHVWMDEEHPEDIYDELGPRLARHNGTVTVTMTPLKGFTWVYHRIYDPMKRSLLDPADHWYSHAGMADNPGIRPEEISRQKEKYKNNRQQLEARLYGHFAPSEGVAIIIDPSKHFQGWSESEIRAGIEEGKLQPFGGLDFGSWRFAFVLMAADRANRAHTIHEYFSQRHLGETPQLTDRARQMSKILERYGIEDKISIWGDSANQQDIVEINAAFRRLEKPYRVKPVAMENKIRSASVTRILDLLGRGALLIRRGIGDDMTWRAGMDASHEGSPMIGSRLLWELGQWQYPEPSEGKAQKQDPDDDTADGADMIAAWRYAVMSWWKGPKVEEREEEPNPNKDRGLERLLERIQEEQNRRRRRPYGVRPRPNARNRRR